MRTNTVAIIWRCYLFDSYGNLYTMTRLVWLCFLKYIVINRALLVISNVSRTLINKLVRSQSNSVNPSWYGQIDTTL